MFDTGCQQRGDSRRRIFAYSPQEGNTILNNSEHGGMGDLWLCKPKHPTREQRIVKIKNHGLEDVEVRRNLGKNIHFDMSNMTLLCAAKGSIRFIGITLEPVEHRYARWAAIVYPERVVGAFAVGDRVSQNIGHRFQIMSSGVENIDSIVTQDGQRHEWCSTLIHNNE